MHSVTVATTAISRKTGALLAGSHPRLVGFAGRLHSEKIVIFGVLSVVVLVAVWGAFAILKPRESGGIVAFKGSEIGRELQACAPNANTLQIVDEEPFGADDGIRVNLARGARSVSLVFSQNRDLAQPKLLAATIDDKDGNVSKLVLLTVVEAICGSRTAAVLLPDQANSLRMLNGLNSLGFDRVR